MAAGPDRKVMFIKSHMDVMQEADTTPLHKQTGVHVYWQLQFRKMHGPFNAVLPSNALIQSIVSHTMDPLYPVLIIYLIAFRNIIVNI